MQLIKLKPNNGKIKDTEPDYFLVINDGFNEFIVGVGYDITENYGEIKIKLNAPNSKNKIGWDLISYE